MRILFLSGWLPHPPNNGSKLRIYGLLRGLAQYHDITLLSFTRQQVTDSDLSELRSLCREVQVVPRKPFDPNSFWAQMAFLSPKPRFLVDTFSPQMAQLIRDQITTTEPELVVASELATAAYSRFLNRAPALFEDIELGVPYERYVHAGSSWQRLRFGLTWTKHRRYLARLIKGFRACTVVSERERQLLFQIAPDCALIEVIPNCINLADLERIDAVPQRNTLIFTGSFHYAPNFQAMKWFLSEVYPRVQAQIPDVHLTITGENMDLPLPPAGNLTLTGHVDDVRPLIAGSWVSLAPIFVGGGTRLKILEAMALGTPVLATTKGAEGIEAQDNRHLLIADTPGEFADAVVRLFSESGLRQRLADHALQLVREKYDWAAVMPRFLELVERTAHPPVS